jgi:hypothetical protein
MPPRKMKKGSRATTFFAIIHLIQYTQKTQTLAGICRRKSLLSTVPVPLILR